MDQEKETSDYEVQFSAGISQAFFFHSGTHLAIIIRGANPGIFLFQLGDGHWHFVNELECRQNQSLLNSRLRHVFVTDQYLCFVYNNRVRKYSLLDGTLIANQVNCPFVLYVGTKKLVKRKAFEEFIESRVAI